MSDKEALARVKIDKLLEESGWRLLDDNQKRKNVVLEQGYRYDIPISKYRISPDKYQLEIEG